MFLQCAAAQRFSNKGKLKTKMHCNKSQLFQFQILDKPRQKRDSALKQESTAGEHINMLTYWSCQWLHYVWEVRGSVRWPWGSEPRCMAPRKSRRVAGLMLEICNYSFATIILESVRKLYLEEPMGCTACGIWGAVAMATRSQQYLESDVRFSALPLGLAALFLLAPFTEQPAPFLHSCTLEIPYCNSERAEPRGF